MEKYKQFVEQMYNETGKKYDFQRYTMYGNLTKEKNSDEVDTDSSLSSEDENKPNKKFNNHDDSSFVSSEMIN